ncbi:MAG: hypothetical protein A3B70_06815 [Deltaproteobacteria bacterium RIFCSPHIGHO2_02_FULL_40_11]|nr:MAG: hypothetical protein A3B70_06815 [Deltaproteobacteria bacterium RIFCSPHIGHO2_02_FULL_40_11]
MKTVFNCLIVLIVLIAFVGGGAWLTHKLTQRAHVKETQKEEAKKNLKVFQSEFKKINYEKLKEIIHAQHKTTDLPLSTEDLQKRTLALATLEKKYTKTHELYSLKCAQCHGKLGQGEITISNMATRMQPRPSPYQTPPLRKTQVWHSSFSVFVQSASKKNSLHLEPTGVEAIDKRTLQDLHMYLKSLTQ